MTTLPLLFRSLAIASPWSLPDVTSGEPTMPPPWAAFPQQDASRVDIAEFANLGIDEAAATTVNAGGFFAEHPPRRVEVMNHHVAEETAELPELLKRRRIRIAAGNRQLFEVADLTALNCLLDRSVSGVKPPVKG